MNRIFNLLAALYSEIKEILEKIVEIIENAMQKQRRKSKRILVMNIGYILPGPRGAGPRMGGVGGINK